MVGRFPLIIWVIQSHLVAPVQMIFPEDQIEAVILGLRSFINTFCCSKDSKKGAGTTQNKMLEQNSRESLLYLHYMTVTKVVKDGSKSLLSRSVDSASS